MVLIYNALYGRLLCGGNDNWSNTMFSEMRLMTLFMNIIIYSKCFLTVRVNIANRHISLRRFKRIPSVCEMLVYIYIRIVFFQTKCKLNYKNF